MTAATGGRAFEEVDNPREVHGWTMYQWAFHGFVTTVATALLGPYLTDLAQAAVGENGRVFYLPVVGNVTAKSFFPNCVAISVLCQVFTLPFLGAIADYTNLKKRLLKVFSWIGTSCTCLLFLVGGPLDFYWGGLLFVIANVSFGVAIVLYNAFLPEITSRAQRDRVSSRGYALGYLAGGLLLAANLALMSWAGRLGISTALAVRISFLSAGVWWGGFSIITFRALKVRLRSRSLPKGRGYLATGASELISAFRELWRLTHTRNYLLSYLFFNDGIQTVISMAALFLSQELFVARGLKEDTAFILGLLLMIQFVGFIGALAFERVARLAGAKNGLVLALVLWSCVVIYGYGFLETKGQAVAMGALIALVLGGSQALSRSLFSCMIPAGREASFFGLYEISASGTSWLGPFLFGQVVARTNSYREALLSLIVLFVLGTVGLAMTKTGRAMADARAESLAGSSLA